MSDSYERLAAALADRYTLEREVGAGGMARVYLARDLRHRRPVAIKVIRPEVGVVGGSERFLREIELVAGLQHPHILPVFDSGVAEGPGAAVPWFVMPFVEGETLRRRVEREGRLPIDEAVVLAREVASALAYAHTHGVIHRDVKPENILLTGGHAVVADFGVAKAIGAGAATAETQLTQAGFALGTPHYMSPEQATGRDPVDARTDQYSLGSMLYEMLAGEPPFAGPTAQAIVAKSLTGPRPRLSRARPEVPPALEQVVLRAMAIDPAERFPDMETFASALRAAVAPPARGVSRWALAGAVAAVLIAAVAGWWAAGRTAGAEAAVAPAAETIAVVPFNASGPGFELLGEGLVDLLSTNLGGVGGVRVVDPRTVLRRWNQAGGGQDSGLERALAVGRDLNAGSVVMGSAVSTGSRVRLAADLHSTAGDRIARAQVDGPSDSVLSLVDRLSVALLRDVWRSREPVPNLRIAALTTDSLEALREFLRGEQLYRRLEFDSALAAYTRAVEVDSSFAMAHLRRSLVYGWTGGYGSDSARAAAEAGFRFAERLPPRDRRLMVGYHLFERGKPASVDSLRAFVADYPEDVEGWYQLGEALFHTREFQPVPPETVSAAFDSVLARDSTLLAALVHPVELALLYRDSSAFKRYLRPLARVGDTARVAALDAVAGMVWGPDPSDSAVRAAFLMQPGWVVTGLNSRYHRPDATPEMVVEPGLQLARVGPATRKFVVDALHGRSTVYAGLGMIRDSRKLADSLAQLAPERAAGLLAWPAALGLLPPAAGRALLDSIAATVPAGPFREYVSAMTALGAGRLEEGRRRLDAIQASTTEAPGAPSLRGLAQAARGWASLLAGDSVAGIRELEEGILAAAAPGADDDTAFLRFQLALALAARPETRTRGIDWLRHGFDSNPLYLPLIQLALGRTYEAAGKADSAAVAYSRFLRLWSQADPEVQGRVREAREALARLTAEPGP